MPKKSVDSHVHLLLSKKQKVPDWDSVRRVLDVAALSGLDALCITEHIEANAYQALIEGLFVDESLEGSSREDGRLTYKGVAIFPGAELELANRCNVGVHAGLDVLMALDREAGAYTLEGIHTALVQRGSPLNWWFTTYSGRVRRATTLRSWLNMWMLLKFRPRIF